jgi:tRNA pseudouridine55 synthase
LILDKPVGPTSHDLVAVVRRELGMKRVGHTGTLDPFASGVLLVCVGSATRLVEYFHVLPKAYEATIVLGDRRDTDDHTGEQIAASDSWKALSIADVEAGLGQFLGSSEQMPPDYSARRVDGRRAHEAAREGDPLKLTARPIEVSEIRLLDWSPPSLGVALTVSTGTYIRAIARDLGERLGCHAHLSSLRRTRIGPFDLDAAADPSAFAEVGVQIVPPLDAVRWMPQRILSSVEVADISMGRAVPVGELQLPLETVPGVDESVVAMAAAGELAAIGVRDGDLLKPAKVFCAA